MRKFKKFIALALCGAMVAGFAGCSDKTESGVIDSLFTESSKISYSLSYKELKASKKNSITILCSPHYIYQHHILQTSLL